MIDERSSSPSLRKMISGPRGCCLGITNLKLVPELDKVNGLNPGESAHVSDS